MRDKGAGPPSQRKPSEDPPRPRNSPESDATFFLLRRKSNRNSQPDDSELVSPSFGATKSRSTYQLGDSKKSNLEATSNSAASSLSLGKGYPLNVTDWNEKGHEEIRSSSRDCVSRHVATLPHPAREGYEWVWFPEGYWAEREWPGSFSQQEKSRKWFRQPSARLGDPSLLSGGDKGSKSMADTSLPHLTVGSKSSHVSSFQSSQKTECKVRKPTNPKSRIRKGLHYVSPTHPHFTSPTGQPEGLYCKFKRGIETKVIHKPQMYQHGTEATSLMSFPSGMTLLLEGTSSYLDRHEYGQREQNTMDRGHLLPETLETPQSADIRPRRGFGLAPWHGRTSQESLLSVSSSVRRLLMGKAPAATPYEEQPYADGGRTIHERVEISEPGQPTFLPSEAQRVNTPPMSAERSPKHHPRGFFFELTPTAPEEGDFEGSAGLSIGSHHPRRIRNRSCSSSSDWRGRNDSAESAASKMDLAKKRQANADMSLPPEHLPSSPLCPKNLMHKSQGREICVYHGRRTSEGLRSEAGGNTSGDTEPRGSALYRQRD